MSYAWGLVLLLSPALAGSPWRALGVPLFIVALAIVLQDGYAELTQARANGLR